MNNMLKSTGCILFRKKMSKALTASIGSWRSIWVGRVIIRIRIRVISGIARCSLWLLLRMRLLLMLCGLISIVVIWWAARRISIRLHWHRHWHPTIRLHWIREIRIRRRPRVTRGHMRRWCSGRSSAAWSSTKIGWRWPGWHFTC